jgi:hypothetical protein
MERWEYLVSSLQNASSEALDIFESTFLAGAARATVLTPATQEHAKTKHLDCAMK